MFSILVPTISNEWLPVAQKPSSLRETVASALARTSPEIKVHSARCDSIGDISTLPEYMYINLMKLWILITSFVNWIQSIYESGNVSFFIFKSTSNRQWTDTAQGIQISSVSRFIFRFLIQTIFVWLKVFDLRWINE